MEGYNQNEVEHIETEELIYNFKNDFEETKKLLEDKISESKERNVVVNLAIEGFNNKLEELQKIIDNMKHVIIEKDISIKNLQKTIQLQAKTHKEELFIRDVSLFF